MSAAETEYTKASAADAGWLHVGPDKPYKNMTELWDGEVPEANLQQLTATCCIACFAKEVRA